MNNNEWCFRPLVCTVRLYWAGTTSANEMNFVLNHVLGAGSVCSLTVEVLLTIIELLLVIIELLLVIIELLRMVIELLRMIIELVLVIIELLLVIIELLLVIISTSKARSCDWNTALKQVQGNFHDRAS